MHSDSGELVMTAFGAWHSQGRCKRMLLEGVAGRRDMVPSGNLLGTFLWYKRITIFAGM